MKHLTLTKSMQSNLSYLIIKQNINTNFFHYIIFANQITNFKGYLYVRYSHSFTYAFIFLPYEGQCHNT